MKSITFLFLCMFSILSLNAQDKKVIAKVYFKRTLDSYKAKDVEKTAEYLEKTVLYDDGISRKEVAIFGAKFYYDNKKYKKAKEYLKAYFNLEKNKKLEEYTEMLVLYTDTIDGLENTSKPKKDIKKVIKKDTSTVKPVVKPEVKKDSIKDDVFIEKESLENSESDQGIKAVNADNTSKNIINGGEPENVPFSIIEVAPIFPGCSGSNRERKDCFSKNVQNHFTRKFNTDLANQLGLSSGRKKVFITFTVKNTGFVKDINVRAPHPEIQKEVVRVMELLPKMKPGTQRGKNVNVKYGFIFTLIVEGDDEKKG
ncbi:hypothetical protein [Polaribacter sp.]|uniref:hypothetical protein n=1 Tax=Polaribacter sp. TaxID=1920175 RepID=UPI003F6B277E